MTQPEQLTFVRGAMERRSRCIGETVAHTDK
jgi:hypothetical protein